MRSIPRALPVPVSTWIRSPATGAFQEAKLSEFLLTSLNLSFFLYAPLENKVAFFLK